VEIPELEIKNSRLAEEVIKILQNTEDKFELAHRMVAIADDRIRNQTSRDVIDLAIEMARTPKFSLTKGDLRKIRHLLLASQEDLSQLESGVGDDFHINRIKYWVEEQLNQIPKTNAEKVHQKLRKGTVDKLARPLSPYLVRLSMPEVFANLNSIDVNDRCGLDRILDDLRERIEDVARIVKSPLVRD